MATPFRPWTPKNPVAYMHKAGMKNIGRGEHRIVWELLKMGVKAQRNPIPGGNPDIVVINAPGIEVKELINNRFRMSAGRDMQQIVWDEIMEPNNGFAQKHFSPEQLTDFRFGTLTARNLKKIPRVDNKRLIKKLFAAYNISHLAAVTPDGFMLLDQTSFVRHFEIYRISRAAMEFIARVR